MAAKVARLCLYRDLLPAAIGLQLNQSARPAHVRRDGALGDAGGRAAQAAR